MHLLITEKYFLKKFISAFIAGIFILTSIFILFGSKEIIKIGIEKQVPFWYLTQFIFFSSLWVFSLTIPMACLLGSIMGISQLQETSEIIALRSCGLSLFQIFKPLFLFGGLLFIIMLIHQHFLLSYFNLQRNQIISQIYSYNPSAIITKKRFVSIDKVGGIERNIYIGDEKIIKNKKMFLNIQIRNINKTKYPHQVESIIIAKKGHRVIKQQFICTSCKAKEWEAIRLQEGYIIEQDPLYNKLQTTRFTYFDLHVKELKNNLNLQVVNPFENLTSYHLLKEYLKKRESNPQEAKNILLDFYRRVSLPFAILLFIFLGCYLPIVSNRSGKGSGIGFSALIIFAYFMIHNFSGTLIHQFQVPILISAWLANLILLLFSLFLYWNRQKV